MTRGQRYAVLCAKAESRRPTKKFGKNLLVKASQVAGHAQFCSLNSGVPIETLTPEDVTKLIKYLKENFVRRDK